MLNLILFTILSFGSMNYKMIDDFNIDSKNDWRIINDGVMGGISTSIFKVNDGVANFSGNVSPENNGGFASVRANVELENLTGYAGVEIRTRGDGKTYSLRFRTNNNFDGISYQAKFKSEEEKWSIVKIPLEKFVPTFRGRTIPNQPVLISEEIKQVGLLIADKQFGEFNIDIDYIQLYKED